MIDNTQQTICDDCDNWTASADANNRCPRCALIESVRDTRAVIRSFAPETYEGNVYDDKRARLAKLRS